MNTTFKTILGLLSILFLAILNGLTILLLWRWFIVPVFGLLHLGIVSAIGLSMIVSYLTNAGPDEREFVEVALLGFFKSIFAISFGWIVHLFM